MNKGLEALDNIKCRWGSQHDIDIIETALKDYEDLQKVLDDFGIHNIQNLIDTLKNISFLETALKNHEETDNQLYNLFEKFGINNRKGLLKKLKALEIIKEKGNFISLEYDKYNDKYYIYDNELYMHNEITKEEYYLLKEVLP